MSKKIQIDINEIREIFLFLEELNGVFHDPTKYRNQLYLIDYVESGMYQKLHRAYYDIVWNWLPPNVQKEIEDRPSPFDSPADQKPTDN